ncbi:hypothetical protein DL96DRAFT_1305848 [Flagelloscypha sp. PMI_526]|nr:hypothetical protein DL96DRAFT_1305848 [Flagelloscypha sp. PMI_526]
MFGNLLRRFHKKKKEKSPPTKSKATGTRTNRPAPTPTEPNGISIHNSKPLAATHPLTKSKRTSTSTTLPATPLAKPKRTDTRTAPPPTELKGTSIRNSSPPSHPSARIQETTPPTTPSAPTARKPTKTSTNTSRPPASTPNKSEGNARSTTSALPRTKPKQTSTQNFIPPAPPPPPVPPPLDYRWERNTVMTVMNLVEEARALTETEVAMDKIWSHDIWLKHSCDSSRLRAALPQLLVLRLQLPKPTEVHGISESFARQTVFEYLLGCLKRLDLVRSRVPFGDARGFLTFFESTILHAIAESFKDPRLYSQPHPGKIGGTLPGPTELVNMLLDLSDGINVIRPWAPSSSYSKENTRYFIKQLLGYLRRNPDPDLSVRDVFLPVVLLLQRHRVQCSTLHCWADDHVKFALEELEGYPRIALIFPQMNYDYVQNELPICKLVGRNTISPDVLHPHEGWSWHVSQNPFDDQYGFVHLHVYSTLWKA